MKIVVVGLGYVGLSNAVLLAQHNEVIGVDLSQDRVDTLKEGRSPIIDAELSEFLAHKDLNLSVTTDLHTSLTDADYVVVSTPTDYNEKTNFFDTSSVEFIISEVTKHQPNACIVVKSTVPLGFVNDISKRFNNDSVIFSPEFLREGKALHDNLYPSRIIVGEKSERAAIFASLLAQGAVKLDIEVLLTGQEEAEAIKLFSNSYLAMRVAFFNELDSYALAKNLNSSEIIRGVSLDPRIGDHYNNPSFGYGGYCLPKDSLQLLANYDSVPQNLIQAIVEANSTRKDFLAQSIIQRKPDIVGVYRLTMKQGSDNHRQSSIQDIMKRLEQNNIKMIVYEPMLTGQKFLNHHLEHDLRHFKKISNIIITNRMNPDLQDVEHKVFTRDVYHRD